MCPLCNGFTNQISETCPLCTTLLVDYGPISFLMGNYSPYEEIDQLKTTNGYSDLENHQCPHQLYCPTCGYTMIDIVLEHGE
ncbi:hypothetical protein [Thermoactinomyces sp. DSM 45891]|uniref:hypothetical protein n=1 Tax=Thermoactinomyces sp. DSM 45891 TaxID=1761907 RepID=UPI000931D361|nr:hypothetical protein [Thermoactinomyces sp. DSM 45891]